MGRLFLVIFLASATLYPALAQGPGVPPQPILTLATPIDRFAALPTQIADIEISESGGITDIFIRLVPETTAEIARITNGATREEVELTVCGRAVAVANGPLPITSGTFYLPNRTAQDGEALRALWSGRMTCDTLPVEVFANAR